MKFLKMVNYEFLRIQKIYFIILGVITGVQLSCVFFQSKSYMKQAVDLSVHGDASVLQFTLQSITSNYFYQLTIWLGIFFMLGYIFFIWYREWFGKHPTIYGKLMLPTPRIHIFTSKLFVIVMMTLGFISYELFLLLIENVMFNSIVSVDFRKTLTIAQVINRGGGILKMVLPGTWIELLFYYIWGTVGVTYAFTLILLERSKRVKGIIFGAGLTALIGAMWLGLFVLVDTYLYPEEAVLLTFGVILLTGIVCITISNYLLKNKVTV